MAESLYDLTGKKQRLFARFAGGALSWDKPRRVIVKAEHSRLRQPTLCGVTNLPQTVDTASDKLCRPRRAWRTGSRISSSTCSRVAPPDHRWWPISSAVAVGLGGRCSKDCGAGRSGIRLAATSPNTLRLTLKIGAR